jgi:hypothetical protein
MIDEPVDAVDGQGQRIHEFGLRVKGACVLKAYGAGGAGQNTRLLAAPEDYPRGGADRLMVTLRSEQGATKEVEVPITVLPPTEHGAGWGDHAPAARTQRPVSSGSSEGFAVQSPAEGEAVHGLRHTASGTGRPGQKVACTVITKDGTPWVQGESTVEQDGTWRLAYQTGEGPVGVGEDFDVVAKSGGEIRHARVHRKD